MDPVNGHTGAPPSSLLEAAAAATASGHRTTPEKREGIDPATVLAGVAEGERDNTLFRYACHLRGRPGGGAPRVEAEALVLLAARSCKPPFPDEQALAKVEQAWGYPAGNGAHVEPVIVRMSDVPDADVQWLRPGWWPRGEASLVAGDPGSGKSMLFTDAMARITTGAEWPEGGRAPMGSVLILAAEDAAPIIKGRLRGLRANLDRVFILECIRVDSQEREVSLTTDLDAIEETIRRVEPVALFIDPITAYLGETDSHVDSKLRGVLAPLFRRARRLNVTTLVLAHLNKTAGRPALYRVGGSIGLVGVVRSVMLVAAENEPGVPDDQQRRVVYHVKSNYAPKQPPLAFAIPDGVLTWVETTDLTGLEELIDPKAKRPQAGIERAVEAILQTLPATKKEAVPRAQIAARVGLAAGVSERTVERALTLLAARREIRFIEGKGNAGHRYWCPKAPDREDEPEG